MSNSNPIQTSCVCMHATRVPCRTTKPNTDLLEFKIFISLGAVLKNSVRKQSAKIHRTSEKVIQQPRQAFVSTTKDEQRDMILTMIQGLEIPFSLQESIHWGTNFPDETTSKFENLDEIIDERLSSIARLCATNDQTGYVEIRIRKLEKVEQKEYEALSSPKANSILDGWILKNEKRILEDQNNKNQLNCWYNKYLVERGFWRNNKYELKLVKMEEEEELLECAICLKDFVKGSQVRRMPCSHIFHENCIRPWLEKSLTCPLCRFDLV